MATIKSYTDLEQSRKLAEILPLESADMCYKCLGEDPYDTVMRPYTDWKEEYKGLLIRGDANVIPCWSLASLLNILAKIASKIDDDGSADLSSFMGQWSINMFDCPVEATDNYDNPIDACMDIIEKLHELNLL